MGRSQAVTSVLQDLPKAHLGHSPVFSVDCVACVCHGPERLYPESSQPGALS